MESAIKERLKHKNARFDRTNSMKEQFYFENCFFNRTIIQCSAVPIFKLKSQPYKRAGKNGSGAKIRISTVQECRKERFRYQNSHLNRTGVLKRTVLTPKLRSQPYGSAKKNGSDSKIQILTVQA